MNPVDLLVAIIKEHAPEDIWSASPLLGYRKLGNTNRGEIGEEFVRRYLKAAGILSGKAVARHPPTWRSLAIVLK